jgi:DNA mismatch repair protein MutS
MSLIKDYFAKTETYKLEYGQKTIILMQVGAFFEVYGLKEPETGIISGSNIMDFSVICDLNVVDKKVCVGKFDVVMAGFKTNFIDKFVKKLQDSGYTTVVITQDENMPNVRDVLGIYSPGTYFPDNVTNELTNNCCCIWIEHTSNVSILKKLSGKSSICVGVGNIDIFTGKTTMFEFQETYLENPTTFDELERFISIYNPSETIIIANLPDDKINNIIKYANIRSQSIHKVSTLNSSDSNITNSNSNNNIKRANNCEKQTYQRELLTKFYKVCDFSSFIQIYNNYSIATQAFCYLLDFVFQHNPGLVNKISEPNFESFGNRLILANHSLKQLNIIEDSNTNASGKYSSVSKMLNECITSMGKRKFTQIFLNPITNETELEHEYALTEYLLLDVNKCKIVRSLLTGIRDLTKLGRQIILRKVTPKALYQLYNNIISIKNLYINHISFDNVIIKYLSCKIDVSNLLDHCDSILEYLNKNLDIELCKDIDTLTSFDINFIKSGVSIDLDSNNILLDNSLVSLNYCKDYFNELITKFETNKKLSSKSKSKAKSITTVENDNNDNEDKEKEYIKIHETDKTNIMLVATDARCKKLKELLPKDNNNSNIIFDNDFELCANVSNIEFYKQSASANTISSSQINQLCKTVSQSKLLVKDLISKAFLQTINGLDNFIDALENISNFITYIDVGYCKAWLADKYHYCRPSIIGASESSFVDTKGLRHCLIEQLQCEELYVANDIYLGENGILLYGTNAVGKTSFIRAIGISVIMAQSGLFVPASNFKYKPYKYIFTRILGNDNLFEGLSTFAVEMSELRTILKLADKNSLVLGDELCSGTESISATSIFVAGIKQLYDKKSSFIFATHLHEIIGYDEITKMDRLRLKHMAVIYDRERDCLIYDRRLQDGPGNNMYGLEVCKSLGLPEDFLELANNIRLKYNPESSSILSKKGSSYNVKQLKTMCEKCNIRPAKEVHHLAHQQDADKNGIIKSDDNSLMFHKNNKANLVSLCEECHDSFHSDNKKVVAKKVKTTKGTIIQEISININN